MRIFQRIPITEASNETLTSLLLALVAVTPSLASIGAQFLNWDDDRFITSNPLFGGSVGAYVKAALTRVQFDAYHPLHLLSYVPDRLLWPRWPWGFHALNILTLAVAVTLLYWLCRRVVGRPAACLACLLFAWHPLVAEPVAWISDRKDLLALAMVLGVLHAEDRDGSAWSRALSFVLAAAAFLTKSSTAVLPVFVFAWHRWVRCRSSAYALGRAAPMAVVAAVVGLFVMRVWRAHSMIASARPYPLLWDVSGTLGFYLARTVVPLNLSPAYPAVAPGHKLLAAAFLGVVIVVAFLWRRIPPMGRFAAVAFIGALLPVSNAIPLYFRFGDRYQLLELGVLTVPVACGIERVLCGPARRWALVALGGAILTSGYSLTRLTAAWHSSLNLWTHAATAQPGAVFAHLKLGETQRSLGAWTAAIASYERAIDLEPRSLLGFAGLFAALGERAESKGKIPAGSTQKWIAEMEASAQSFDQLQRLVGEIGAAGCSECAHALLWMTLRMYTLDDRTLEALAERSLAAGRAAAALIFLGEMGNRSSPAYRKLYARARASVLE